MIARRDLRNLAIIAHVDHGKTTLVDGLLRQARVFRENQQVAERVMDSNDLERERGITILAKNTAIRIWDAENQCPVRVNIVDTPGHADFGGEVERVMNMVDGVLLLVDAAEGPMPQTRFVLKKALEKGHRAVVVINKVDRRGADPTMALNRTFDLFLELGATDEQADFPVVYTNALTGQAGLTPDLGPDLAPLYHAILRHIPCPVVDPDAPLQMLVANLGYDDYRGVTAVGRIHAGRLVAGQEIARLTLGGATLADRARYLYIHEGLERVEVPAAEAGEIVVVAGLEGIAIGETIADPVTPLAMPAIHVEEPTVRMTFGVNTSPFSGREGRWSTSRRLRERLFEELRRNVALRVEETGDTDTFAVSGRGELHLAILIETMRREGYEFQVGRPRVLYKKDENGTLLEPIEEATVDAPSEYAGKVIEVFGSAGGEMSDMITREDQTQLVFKIPSRGTMGLRTRVLNVTRGEGIMFHHFYEYGPYRGEFGGRQNGSMISMSTDKAVAYALDTLQQRGRLFVGPGDECYEGMIVGESAKEGDMVVNIAKSKSLGNQRSSSADKAIMLTPPITFTLEEALEYIEEDELVEVTPKSIRLRKRLLSEIDRRKQRVRSGQVSK